MAEADETPVRSHMDDPGIAWRHGKPDYTKANKNYLQGKSRSHKPGSLEKIVEDLVKTWEMESTHKTEKKDWGTIDREKFRISVNGGRKMDVADNVKMGNYLMFLEDSPLYNIENQTHDSSHAIFKKAFPEGFPWELLDVISGPPNVVFTWRHWAKFTGPFKDLPPTGDSVELFGCCIAKVNDELKIEDLQIYYDPSPMMTQLTEVSVEGCPIARAKAARK